MNRAEKQEFAKELTEKFTKAQVAIFADYKGLKAADADQLRRSLRTLKTDVRVLKNNLARKAIKECGFGEEAEALLGDLVGPTLVAFAYEDPAAAAKIIHKYTEDNEALQLKDSLMGKKKLTAAEVEQLAKLPSREVLLGMLLGAFNGPIRNFAGVLAAVPRSFVTVLSQIEKKKRENQ